MEYIKRYDEHGNVAVLISTEFGAGWSTWAQPDEAEALLFDSRIVDAVLSGRASEDIVILCKSLGYESYMGGAGDLIVEWLEPGTRFLVEEYDGNESIRTFDSLTYVA